MDEVRKRYADEGLRESDLAPDPITMFDRWYADAVGAGVHQPEAMVVSTVSPEGRPSSRLVLLKGVDVWGFRFYTNLLSRKGVELAANPSCSLLFPWHQIERQVRVDGVASQLLREDVAAYFGSRPRGSRLGSWASHQSRTVAGREELATSFTEAEARFEGIEVPVPPEWGGFVVRPEVVEFWQGRPGRMHDRLVYRRDNGGWATHRLAP